MVDKKLCNTENLADSIIIITAHSTLRALLDISQCCCKYLICVRDGFVNYVLCAERAPHAHHSRTLGIECIIIYGSSLSPTPSAAGFIITPNKRRSGAGKGG